MHVVFKTIPAHGAENVPLDQVIGFQLMVDIQASTINEDTVLLMNLTEQKVEPITFHYQNKRLEIAPNEPLQARMHYQVILVGGEKGLKDITGRSMPQSYELEFVTGDSLNTKIPIIMQPVDRSVMQEAFTIQLEAIDDIRFFEVQISKSNTFQNVIWPTKEHAIYRLDQTVVKPDLVYEPGAYYLRARSVNEQNISSAWSVPIRFYYEEPKIAPAPPVGELPDDPVIEEVTPQVIIESRSKRAPMTALSKLQEELETFVEPSIPLWVKQTNIKDQTIHYPRDRFNQTRQIVIEFSEDLEPTSITNESCYVLKERN